MCSQASSKKNCRWGARGSGSHKDSFADVSLDDPLTLLASYVAAPVVLAVAALHQLLWIRVVATAAAHQITAVTANWGFVALPRVSKERKHWIKFSSFYSKSVTLLKTAKHSLTLAMIRLCAPQKWTQTAAVFRVLLASPFQIPFLLFCCLLHWVFSF